MKLQFATIPQIAIKAFNAFVQNYYIANGLDIKTQQL